MIDLIKNQWIGIVAIVLVAISMVGSGGSQLGAESTTFTNPLTFEGVVSMEAESNKIGSANTYNPLYFGAGDGCAALLTAASGTLTTTATATSFCN